MSNWRYGPLAATTEKYTKPLPSGLELRRRQLGQQLWHKLLLLLTHTLTSKWPLPIKLCRHTLEPEASSIKTQCLVKSTWRLNPPSLLLLSETTHNIERTFNLWSQNLWLIIVYKHIGVITINKYICDSAESFKIGHLLFWDQKICSQTKSLVAILYFLTMHILTSEPLAQPRNQILSKKESQKLCWTFLGKVRSYLHNLLNYLPQNL